VETFKTGNITLTDICLDSTPKYGGTMRSITLKLVNWSGDTPNISSGGTVVVTSQSHNRATRVSTFSIEAKAYARGVDFVLNSSSEDDSVLKVTVGPVRNHGGFIHDLVADLLGRSEDPVKLWVYTRILAKENNVVGDWASWDSVLKDQPLKQITDPAHPANWNCGAALNKFGNDFFGARHFTIGDKFYYKPFGPKVSSANKSDIKFDGPVVTKGIKSIKSSLSKGVAVRVFVVHHEPFTVGGGRVKASGNTHYLTIVGCDDAGENFLVTDPWPSGSKLTYTSGIFGDVDSAFMGLLKYSSRWDLIFTPVGQRGGHDYWVLTGP